LRFILAAKAALLTSSLHGISITAPTLWPKP
jgi:hypothetical protein